MYRLFFIFFFVLFGCSQTVLTSAWYDRAYYATQVQTMLVVAMSDNLRIRRIFEDKMVQKLQQKGVDATASYKVYPEELPTKQQINQYVTSHQIQTVFVGQLVNIEDKNVRYPNGGFGTGVSFSNYYGSTYGYIYDNSYTVTYEYVNLEFTLFDTRTSQPIWSASSESVDPTDINQISDELTNILVTNMEDSILRTSSQKRSSHFP